MMRTVANPDRKNDGERTDVNADRARPSRTDNQASSAHSLQQTVGNQAVKELHARGDLAPAQEDAVDPQPDEVSDSVEAHNRSTDAGGRSSGSPTPPGEAPATSDGRGTESFPHRSRIERSIGLRIPGQVITDASEPERRGVLAFTDDTTTYFGDREPDLEVAAHEATHVVQHAGLTRDANLGAERHAAAVAQRVNTGRSARDLIGHRGANVSAAVRPYVEVRGKTDDFRISEDSNMAVRQDGQQHHFWAHSQKISESNGILGSKESVIRLRQQSGRIKLPASIAGRERTLPRVLPENVANASKGENMNLWADCGKSARDVMGAGRGTGRGYDEMTAVFGPGETKRTSASQPEPMKKEILNEEFGTSGDEGLRKYRSLSSAEQDRIDRKLGINEYATPETGEGYTMSTGGTPYPGERTWNFHWAGVVMTSNSDRTVLENYAVGDPSVQNTDWEFQMYGPASEPGQTFHEQHEATEQHGQSPTTMEVKKRESKQGFDGGFWDFDIGDWFW